MRLSLPKGAMRGLVALCLLAACAVPQQAFAQSAAEAQLAARVQDLESSVRDLTGQVEELQHALQLLQQQMQKMQQDDEFRFQQLEGAPDEARGTVVFAAFDVVLGAGQLPGCAFHQ